MWSNGLIKPHFKAEFLARSCFRAFNTAFPAAMRLPLSSQSRQRGDETFSVVRVIETAHQAFENVSLGSH